MKSIFKSFQYLKGYTGKVILNFFLTVIVAALEVISLFSVLPFLRIIFSNEELQKPSQSPGPFHVFPLHDLGQQFEDNFNFFMYNMSTQYSKLEILINICMFVVVVFLVKNLFIYWNKMVEKSMLYNVAHDQRQLVYEKVLKLPMTEISEQNRGNILTLFSNDITKLENSVLSGLNLLIKDPIKILFYLGSMLLISLKLTLFIFLLVPTLGFVIGQISRSLKKKSTKYQEQFGILVSYLDETMFGAKVIKSFTAERFLKNRFGFENRNLKKVQKKIFFRSQASSPVSEVLGILMVMIVLGYGGSLILTGGSDQITGEMLIAYLLLFSQMITPIKSLSNQYASLQNGLASGDRINEFLNSNEEYKTLPKEWTGLPIQNHIVFDNVSFRYPNTDKYVLKNFELEIPKGTVTALVGPSGAGKSTVADLIQRFFEVQEGNITIDGKNINEIPLEELRSLFSYVSQETILFHDTVANNIAFGLENVTREQIIEAAKIANAHDFIIELDHGYDTNVGERGTKLSGGQKQRITIARAILRNAPILVMDEATSALDTESERLVQEAIEHLLENRTALVIAHRLSTIKNVDNICVMDKGQIIEQGNHDDLMALENGHYKSLSRLQTID